MSGRKLTVDEKHTAEELYAHDSNTPNTQIAPPARGVGGGGGGSLPARGEGRGGGRLAPHPHP